MFFKHASASITKEHSDISYTCTCIHRLARFLGITKFEMSIFLGLSETKKKIGGYGYFYDYNNYYYHYYYNYYYFIKGVEGIF